MLRAPKIMAETVGTYGEQGSLEGRTMRVLVDAVGNRGGGGGVVLLEVIRELLVEPVYTEIIVCCSPSRRRGIEFPAAAKMRIFEQLGADTSMARRLYWLEYGCAKLAMRMQADRILFMNGAGQAPSSCPSISFVQQALPLTPINWETPWTARLRKTILRWAIARGVRRATKVAVQRVGMRDLLVHEFGLSGSQIEVFEPGPPPFPALAVTGKICEVFSTIPRDRRVLYVGNAEPYKNINVAIEAVTLVNQRWPGATLLATCERPPGIEDSVQVCWLGALNRAETRRAYEEATVLIMPSRVESLGLPLLEAMALEVPILAADVDYAREVCPGSALFFNVNSPRDAAEKLERLLTDGELRQSLKGSGLRIVKERLRQNAYRNLARRLAEISLPPAVATL